MTLGEVAQEFFGAFVVYVVLKPQDRLTDHQRAVRLRVPGAFENQRMLHDRGEFLRQTPSPIRFLSAEPLLGPLCLDFYLPLLDWVIVGGGSGPRVRPIDPAWVRSIRDQCVTTRVAFFFKQWGGKTPKAGGRELDGRTWDEMPKRRES